MHTFVCCAFVGANDVFFCEGQKEFVTVGADARMFFEISINSFELKFGSLMTGAIMLFYP